MFVLFVYLFVKVVLLKVAHPLKIYANTKVLGPMLTSASLASISEV
jgi:hypothetical protein